MNVFRVQKRGIMNTYKHLTLHDRITIQNGITNGKSLLLISREIHKAVSTVTKEIKRHLISKKSNSALRRYNPCSKAKTCRRRHICKSDCGHVCSYCGLCTDKCKDFEYMECKKLKCSPFCCNGCKAKVNCSLLKKYYYAEKAESEYRQVLKETRTGFCLTEDEAEEINKYVEPLIKQGQSIHHICSTLRTKIPFCEKTFYTYVDNGVFNLKNIDLPRKVRYKQRKKPKEHKVDSKCRISRTLEDFKEFMEDNDNPSVVQMDTVKGSKTGKVLLTIHFVSCSFMLAYIRENNSSQSVTEIFDLLYNKLGRKLFVKLFPVILTDNGTEFSNPIEIEYEKENGEKRTSVFYCDAGRSDQKGSIEVNHEFIRRISPKGNSFDERTQDDINLMMSHINSYARKKLNDKTPYEMFTMIYGKEAADTLGIKEIPNKEIILKPNLFGKK